MSSYIVKATYGAEIRKWKSSCRGKHSDLVKEVLGEFGIEVEKIHLKYKDSDGDLVELSSNEDLELAVELEKALNVVVINDSEDLPKSLIDLRSSLSSLSSLIADATSLVGSLNGLNLHDKKSNLAHTRDSVSSSVKSEPIATIHPSSLEEIQLNEPNGTIHEAKPPTYENNGIGIQSFPIKSSQFAGPIGYSPQQQNLPPLNQVLPSVQPPSGYAQPTNGNYGQPQQQQFQLPTQPPVYAPIKLTPGWNAPPMTFFK